MVLATAEGQAWGWAAALKSQVPEHTLEGGMSSRLHGLCSKELSGLCALFLGSCLSTPGIFPLLLARLTMRLDNGGLGPTSGKRRGLELYLHNAVWDPRRPGLCLLWLVLICYLLAVMTHSH